MVMINDNQQTTDSKQASCEQLFVSRFFPTKICGPALFVQTGSQWPTLLQLATTHEVRFLGVKSKLRICTFRFLTIFKRIDLLQWWVTLIFLKDEAPIIHQTTSDASYHYCASGARAPLVTRRKWILVNGAFRSQCVHYIWKWLCHSVALSIAYLEWRCYGSCKLMRIEPTNKFTN
jgi:hypothetical protein